MSWSRLSAMTQQLPEASLVYVLGLLGGVGGSIALAAYGYWLREKGWREWEAAGRPALNP